MKKLLSLLCLMGILAGALSACGKDETDEAAPQSDKTLLTAATELANELDKVPTITELINGKMENSVTIEGFQPLNSADADYGIAPLGVELCGVDTYYPKEPPKEEQTQDPDAFRPIGDGQFFSGADATVANLKLVKNHALSACKTFSTWVTFYIEQTSANMMTLPGHGVYRDYRLQYDVNRDVVVIEERYESKELKIYYVRIAVSYTPDGKLQMNGVSAIFTDSGIADFTQLSYLEDSYYISIGNETPYNSHTLSVYDLKSGDWALAEIRNDGEFDLEGNPISEITQVLEETYYYASAHMQFTADKASGEILDSDGSYGGQWGLDGRPQIILSLDFFDGWTSVSNEDGQKITLVTPKGEFEFANTPTGVALPEAGCKYNLEYYGERHRPTFSVSADHSYILPDDENIERDEPIIADRPWTREDARQIIQAVCDKLGISFKDGYEDEVLSGIFGYEEHRNAFHYIDGITGADLTMDVFRQMIDSLLTEEASHASLLEMRKEPAIAFEEQTAEYEYFEFLSYELSVSGTCDHSTNEISLNNVKASISPSILLKEDTVYSLVFVWASAAEHLQVGSIDQKYTGEKMVFEGSLTISTDKFPKELGEYVLMAYLADADGLRISALQAVPADEDFSAELSAVDHAATLTLTKERITVNTTLAPKQNVGENIGS